MERIYSAFFTPPDRRKEALPPPPVTTSATRDESAADAAKFAAARRVELEKLVQNRVEVKRDLLAAVRAAVRAFVYAYGAKAFTALLLASRRWSSLEYGYADAARLLLRADTLRFGAFFGSLVGVYRFSELAVRCTRNGERDATTRAIAGGVAGLALLVDAPARRSTLALYLFVRMLDVVARHLVAVKALPAWPHASESLFALSNVAIMYAFVVDPSLLPKVRYNTTRTHCVALCRIVLLGYAPNSAVDMLHNMLHNMLYVQGYYQWICRMGGVNHQGLEFTVRQRMRGQLDAAGAPLPFRPCQPHYHM